jgi:hypothetical protein
MNTSNDSQSERAAPRDWEQIRDDYIRGAGSLRQLAERHGLPLSTVEARCRRERWVSLREKRQKAGLETLVGVPTGNAVIGAVEDRDWWAEQDREHLQQNLELTRRLRQAVEKKIANATANELERLGGALEGVVNAERVLLELTPRTAKNKAPSLRPRKPEYGSREWRMEMDARMEAMIRPVTPSTPNQPAATDTGHPVVQERVVTDSPTLRAEQAKQAQLAEPGPSQPSRPPTSDVKLSPAVEVKVARTDTTPVPMLQPGEEICYGYQLAPGVWMEVKPPPPKPKGANRSG